MGRYNFAARNVHRNAANLLRMKRLAAPPPWFDAIGSTPPAEVLTRPVLQARTARSRRKARMFMPVELRMPEDNLRWEFYNDHPWELARPRVMVENDGLDHTRWDWSHALSRPIAAAGDPTAKAEAEEWDREHSTQAARPLNGEAVVQRQQWLMQNENLSEAAAYDKARKEFYRTRHMQEIEQRVAKEEAQFYGGVFGLSALEVGMKLEDKAYEEFVRYAESRISDRKAGAASQGPIVDAEEVEETAA